MFKRKKEISVEMVRSVDLLGRVVIPKEFRNLYGIDCEDKLRIIAVKEGILLIKSDVK